MALVSACKPRCTQAWSLCDAVILVTKEWEASLTPPALGLFTAAIRERGFTSAAFRQG